MDSGTVRTLQQIEFFLLHDLVVNELRVVKRARRVTPVHGHYTMNQRSAVIGRLFKSFLMKLFPAPVFAVSKRLYHQEFEVRIIDTAIRERLRQMRDSLPAAYQSLQPAPEEIGLLRFDFPNLTFRITTQRRQRKWEYHNGIAPHEVGIGRYCPAAKAAFSWKRRFEEAVKAAETAEEEVGPPAPLTVNRAQEQLEAVLRAAAEAGRL